MSIIKKQYDGKNWKTFFQVTRIPKVASAKTAEQYLKLLEIKEKYCRQEQV